ncbi:hypothetical protein MNBD_DELTA01-1096 [hydrothermal vent metagenome]|uniref:DUF507 domain-containing protein n=1 Tax=hydrothermal vent metagenome TaxID=652676 RepID=A0A3B0R995_9ZZZZ
MHTLNYVIMALMKLTEEQIERVTAKILENLKNKGLVELKANEKTVLTKMNEVLTKDLSAEDALDREVDGMLDAHSSDVDSGAVDYRKVFNMVKHKLARERGIIL